MNPFPRKYTKRNRFHDISRLILWPAEDVRRIASSIENIVFLRYICPPNHSDMNKYFIYAFAAFAMISCSDYITPDGEIVDCNIEIPAAADGIEITDGMKLVLSEEIPVGTAVIRTHFNIQQHIKAETAGDRIVFTVDARRFKDLDITITTSPASYHDFTASGGSEIYSPETVQATMAAFTLSGGSRATLSAACGTAVVNCSGGSELTLKGSCDKADIVCSGGSRCYAYGFDTAAATVDISGGSALEITVSESLTGDNSGGSHIRYKGVPARLNVNNNGGSTTSAAE